MKKREIPPKPPLRKGGVRQGAKRRVSGLTFTILPLMVILLVMVGETVFAGEGAALKQALKMPKASLILEEGGETLIARHPDRPQVPASTMKILTALAAIQRWGLEYRFQTDFFMADDWLWVKGHGDPYLISEELDTVVDALKRQGVRRVMGIGTDDTLFAPNMEIAGRSSSNNPYDAPVTALAVNFNTVSVVRTRAGEIRGAEPQTPLTPMARKFSRDLGAGKHRVNLQTRDNALRYFAELLGAKLKAAGIQVGDGHRVGPTPGGAKRIYRHRSSRDLRVVLDSMLEYSNNFIANSLFLLLGQEGASQPLTLAGSQRAMTRWAQDRFQWRGFVIEDGAGLSRGNRLSARQLVEAVKAFGPYRELLPEQNSRVRAKTGTLRGVSTYAGYVKRANGWAPFSLLINQSAPYDLRKRVAEDLARIPNPGRL